MYLGSDPAGVPENTTYYTGGLPSFNIIANNLVDTATEGIKIGDTVGNEFTGNVSGRPRVRMRVLLGSILLGQRECGTVVPTSAWAFLRHVVEN